MLLGSQKIENYQNFLSDIITEFFKVSLLSYLFFYLLENFVVGFVVNFFNLNILLYLTIISGVVTVWIKDDKKVEEAAAEKQKFRIREIIFIILLGIISSLLIYYKIKEIGWVALVIAPLSGIIVILLSFLIYNQNDNETRE